MTLDRNAVGLVIAAFMEADFNGWTAVARGMNTWPQAQREAMEERMVKHAVAEQVREQGRDAVLRQFSDIGTRRSDGGDYYARIGKDQTEAALESLSAFVRSLPEA